MTGAIVLWVTGGGLMLVGVIALIDPLMILGSLGIAPSKPEGTTELRVIFGALHVGLGAFIAGTAARAAYRRAGLVLVLLVVGTVTVVRFPLMIVADSWTSFHMRGLAIDLVVVLAAAYALSRRETAAAVRP